MKKQSERPSGRAGEIRIFGLTALLLLVCFLIAFYVIWPVRFDNYGGKHMWLAGSTVKFINVWLQDGLLRDRFTFYESFRSIEYASLAERTPYVSYPTLSALFPYLLARLLFKTHVGLSFVKHFALFCYAAEMLFFAGLVYLGLKDLRAGTPRTRAVLTFFTALFWVLIPSNLWYQINVFWVDQAVIFWIYLYLLLEYLHLRGNCRAGKRRILLDAGRAAVIFCGILTDYYFWIFIFLAFLFRVITLLRKRTPAGRLLREAAVYVLPVLSALLAFLWQLSHVADWKKQLTAKFLERTGTESENNVFVDIFLNFARTQADFSAHRALLLALLIFAVFLMIAVYVRKSGKLLLPDSAGAPAAILQLGIAAPVVQILFLKNHSAVHEYALVKLSFVVAAAIPVFAVALCFLVKKSGEKNLLSGRRHVTASAVSLLAFLWLTNAPFSIRNFLNERDWDVQYPLAEYLYENAGYRDVYYTFTTPVKKNPPEQLAIAQKEVHLISTPDELETLYPGLPEEAVRHLVIQKDYIVEDPDLPVTTQEGLEQVRGWEEKLTQDAEVIWENDSCLVVRLP